MSIRNYQGKSPQIGKGVYIDPDATIIGDVTIGEDSSIWPQTVVRGDVNRIQIGDRTNIQDGSVCHVAHAGKYSNGFPLIVGNDVTVGHNVNLHACEIHDYVLCGIGSIIMDGAVLQSEVILGAGSLVAPRKVLDSGYLWLGNPAKKIRPLTDEEKEFLRYSAAYYVKLKNSHTEKQ